jgi:hypothetical protein
MRLTFSIEGDDLEKLVHEIVASSLFEGSLPIKVWVDNKAYKIGRNWIHETLEEFDIVVDAQWDERWYFISCDIDGIIKVSIPEFPNDAHLVLQILAPMSWTLISFDGLHEEWYPEERPYIGYSLDYGHFPLGWGCAFKGKGHDQLVSRRWLYQGPWLYLCGEHDTTLIQFHDLNADSDTALKQAKTGHERMASPYIGGYVPSDYKYQHDLRGLYFPDQRKQKIITIDREVTQKEMLDARALVIRQDPESDTPIDSIAYIFVESKAAAQPYLHELWLRGLECWAIDDGIEMRLDSDYQHVPIKPDWVKKVLAEGNNQQ